MFNIGLINTMDAELKTKRDILTKECDNIIEQLELIDDVIVAFEYLENVSKVFNNYTDGEYLDIVNTLYNIPSELSSLVMLPNDEICGVREKILDFAKSNIPGKFKSAVNIKRIFTTEELRKEYSQLLPRVTDSAYSDVSSLINLLQIIQVWFACKYVMDYKKEEDLK